MIAFMAGACASGPEDLCRPYPVQDEAAYRQSVEEQRKQREDRYRNSDESPVPGESLPNWPGLEFYAVNPGFRVAGPLVRRTNGREFAMATTGGELRPCRETGYFLLDFGAGPQELPVYSFEGDETLFLPFTDETTESEETYPAGRYLEISSLDAGRYLLDFNLAYNPYCAYGGTWDCPIAPRENRLNVAVTAGEKGWVEAISEPADER
jgi:uncharacterized protein (DUF1684 family)